MTDRIFEVLGYLLFLGAAYPIGLAVGRLLLLLLFSTEPLFTDVTMWM